MSNLPSALEEYERYILDWVKAAVGDGMALLRRERAYNDQQNAVKFITGEQYPLRSRTISRLVDNRLRKAAFEIISSMTDVRPIWNYETLDRASKFKDQGEILSKLARGWWKANNIDRRLNSTLMWSLVGGTGYGYMRWNELLPGGGDIEMLPLDPRDVIPIEPVFSDSIQDWRGVIIRRNEQIENIKQMFPTKAWKVGAQKGSWFTPMTKEGGSIYNVVSSAWSVLTRGNEGRQRELPNTADLFYIYVKDEAIHTGDKPKLMGDVEKNYHYIVYPLGSAHPMDGHLITEEEARLYPRGRLIICTTEAVCSDGPNPYWHGWFPLVKFTLEPLPWSLLGASIIGDMIPLQNALNEALRGIEDGMSQWLRRGVVADQHAISRSTLDAIDTRKAGFKAYLNNNAGGEGFKVIDGPTYPGWYMNMIDWFKNEIDENLGVRNLRELAQMKQMPNADTVDKFMDTLSPLLKIRARAMEISLGEVAEMLKVNFFQYYTTKRRMEILGEDGVSLEDYDYDPGTLVPDDPENPNEPRQARAQKHHKSFKFSIAPNSFLNISHSEHKMLMLQLFRANMMDPWTVWKELDTPNMGPEPDKSVPERMILAKQLGLIPGQTPEQVSAQNQLQSMQVQMQMIQLQMQMSQMGGMPGPEVPGNSGVGPEGGRPPSGAQPPQFVAKPGEGRTVVSESGR